MKKGLAKREALPQKQDAQREDYGPPTLCVSKSSCPAVRQPSGTSPKLGRLDRQEMSAPISQEAHSALVCRSYQRTQLNGVTRKSKDEKYNSRVAFRETDETLLRVQMLADRLQIPKIDALARLVFRWGLISLEAAVSAGLFLELEELDMP
jgi:hypothetical protein